MGLLDTIIRTVRTVAAAPFKDAPDKEVEEAADEFVRSKLSEARQAADRFLDCKVEEIEKRAWLMVDMLEKRVDAKLAELERRLDERLQKELRWKLIGLRWTLFFVLLMAAVSIGYALLKRHL